MKFDYICDGLPDGLVLIDEAYFDEFDEEMLYSLDIMLDTKGRTELIYDFPGEEWRIVWERESLLIKDFCDSGKMFIYLCDKDMENCEIELLDSCEGVHINVPSGRLVLVNAGEMIQCLLYPELEMEKLLEINVEPGSYNVECEDISGIKIGKGEIL